MRMNILRIMKIKYNILEMPTFPKYTRISIINRSTVVTDTDGSYMTTAMNMILPTFCKDWSVINYRVSYVPTNVATIPANSYHIYIYDNADVSGVLAYHDIQSAVPFGRVFAKTVLQNKGVVLYEPTLTLPTVAQAVSHEIFELIIDPRCNIWWMHYFSGLLVAGEVCDPVQSNVVVITLANKVKVGLSDWVLPSWQCAQNTTGPFNHLKTLTAPFQVKNGYVMAIKNSRITNAYGMTANTNLTTIYGNTVNDNLTEIREHSAYNDSTGNHDHCDPINAHCKSGERCLLRSERVKTFSTTNPSEPVAPTT